MDHAYLHLSEQPLELALVSCQRVNSRVKRNENGYSQKPRTGRRLGVALLRQRGRDDVVERWQSATISFWLEDTIDDGARSERIRRPSVVTIDSGSEALFRVDGVNTTATGEPGLGTAWSSFGID
jgi:hypothetical protein